MERIAYGLGWLTASNSLLCLISALWNRSQSEPTFKGTIVGMIVDYPLSCDQSGLDMTMEEVRWEFYKHSQQEWPKLQQIIEYVFK